jgi:hypothetical protein
MLAFAETFIQLQLYPSMYLSFRFYLHSNNEQLLRRHARHWSRYGVPLERGIRPIYDRNNGERCDVRKLERIRARNLFGIKLWVALERKDILLEQRLDLQGRRKL